MTEFENILKEPTWFAEGGPESDVVCSSRARLSRNLSSFLFPNKLSDKESAEVQQSIQQAFQRSKYKENLRIGLLEDLPVLERRKMIERHFLSQNYSLQK
ncbi:MAG TPA: hypothetical protein ENN41_04165, partial [Sediminispirochaeta sp.]|nr:hypothetical protein [Sediminispirochaeta sp.]